MADNNKFQLDYENRNLTATRFSMGFSLLSIWCTLMILYQILSFILTNPSYYLFQMDMLFPLIFELWTALNLILTFCVLCARKYVFDACKRYLIISFVFRTLLSLWGFGYWGYRYYLFLREEEIWSKMEDLNRRSRFQIGYDQSKLFTFLILIDGLVYVASQLPLLYLYRRNKKLEGDGEEGSKNK